MAWPTKSGVVVESVYFNGRKYNRYPNSDNAAHRKYFARAGHRLHRDVWEFHNGPIPAGWQVHHRDEDTSNNDISNLECLSFRKHREKHLADYVRRGKSDKQLAHLARINALAKAWHRTPEGREWHRQNALTSMRHPDAPKPYSKSRHEKKCVWCGGEFVCRSIKKLTCSSACQTAKSKYLTGARSKCHPYYAASVQSDG